MRAYRFLGIVTALLSAAACSSSAEPKDTASGAASEGDDDTANDDEERRDGSTKVPLDGGRPGTKLDGAIVRIDAGGRTVDARIGPSSSDGSQSSGDALVVADSSRGAEDSFEACRATLKSPCAYDDKETSCASVTTPAIPLTSGETWGNKVVEGGPHGAYVEWNEGKDFANPVGLLESACTKEFVALAFGEPEAVNADVVNLRGQDLALYTIFRPACMRDGEKYPVITWGNGTCGQTGGYATLLANLASHGFVVVASNSRYTNQGNNEMLKALDLAKALHEDESSPLYQRLDLEKIGAMGHSQGASATAAAARDPRIKATILWNGGRSGAPAKPFLAVSGDRDTGNPTVSAVSSFTTAAEQPGAWLFFHQVLETGGSATGHLTLMMQPERVTELTVAWWKYMLQGDQEARKMFVGSDCGLCGKMGEFEYGQRALP